jgi:NAD(P)-dependent dehydrogenase (short-subunit alcohol dehydrogenase family)
MEVDRMSLEGRRALVTGGSRGLGRAIAERLAALGADLGVVGRDRAALEATGAAVADLGRRCVVIEADLATPAGARSAGERALEHHERWDVLVNNAGIAVAAPLLDVDFDDWDRVQAVNVKAALAVAQVLVPGMIERRSGKVVNVSSVGAFVGTPGLGAYAASKAAMNQLTRTMAVEWGPYGIQVNAVCPTIVLTDMGRELWDDPARAEDRRQKEQRIPERRFGEPSEVADAVAFLAGGASAFINGVTLPLDGGMLAAP